MKLAVILWLFLSIIVCDAKNNRISVTLVPKWGNTPLLAEASEYVAEESTHAFWKFLDLIISESVGGILDSVIPVTTPLLIESDKPFFEMIEELALEAIGGGSSMQPVERSMHKRLFRLFTASRTYSPRVEMAHQLALTSASQIFNCSQNEAQEMISRCGMAATWVHVGSMAVCDLLKLEEALKTNSDLTTGPELYPQDKIYNLGTSGSSAPKAILYGDLSHIEFYKWHKKLKSLADKGLCVYVFRHYFEERVTAETHLNGYGVQLALKSTEYKAMDDTKVDDQNSNTDNSTDNFGEDAVVRGFNFTQLVNIHPELKNELKEFQSYLLTTDNELRPLKAWQFRQLGLQASQAVMDSLKQQESGNTSDHIGLVTLRDISQNLPSRASGLVNLKVSSNLNLEVSNNQLILTENLGIQPGQNLLILNGMILSPNVDIFALLDLLRQEAKVMKRLHNLGIPNDVIPELLISMGNKEDSSGIGEVSTPGSRYSISGRFTLDITTAPIIYMNNLELDSAYSYWPDTLYTLFTPDFSGGIRRLRKNLYNVVLVVDPASAEAREMIKLTESFLLHMTAIRFGFLWDVDPTVNSTSLFLVRILNFICTTIRNARESPFEQPIKGLGSPGPMAALSFLTELYSDAEKLNTDINLKLMKLKFEKLFPDALSEDIFDPAPGACEYDVKLDSQYDFLIRSGLHSLKRSPLILFNGVILDSTGIRKMGGFEDTIVSLCMEELVRIQTALLQQRMASSDSVFDLYKRTGIVLARFNPRVLESHSDRSNHEISHESSESEVAKYLQIGETHVDALPSDLKPERTSSKHHLLTYFMDRIRYYQKGGSEPSLRPVTIWVVIGDLDLILDPDLTDSQRAELQADFLLAINALNYIRSEKASKSSRLGFLFNPSKLSTKAGPDAWLTRAVHLVGHPVHPPVATSSKSTRTNTGVRFVEPMIAHNFASRLFKEGSNVLRSKEKLKPLSDLLVSGMDLKEFESMIQQHNRDEMMQLHSWVAQDILGLKPGQRTVVINGHVLGPLNPEEEFVTDDFHLIERMALDEGAQKVGDVIKKLMGDKLANLDAVSELTWQVTAVLKSGLEATSQVVSNTLAVEGISDKPNNGRRIRFQELSHKHSGFTIPGKQDEPNFELVALMDPASQDAQRLSHILLVLQKSLPCLTKVYLNPVQSLSELPVKRFYRFVWEPTVFSHDTSSEDAIIPRAYFTNLPGQSLLTLGMNAPHGWMVAAVEAVHDLDNLKLADIRSTQNLVEAIFQLEYLLLEGHCAEEATMKPPRGLQFTLGPASDLNRYDTIVMANLGYFQLKAGPGAWHLNLRSGKSANLYTISSHDHTDTPSNSTEVITLINSFRSKIISVRVSKRPERASESLLDDDERSPTSSTPNWIKKPWSTISNYAEAICPSWLTSLKKLVEAKLPWNKCPQRHETINIFSVASGHLYERLLRIMMLTVLRHTHSPVKFWFLKNYLSPSFKDFIPHMSKEYGFEYEFVQYQWPRWLHAQTEKQRIIWGYKILFLDVLFPLNVTKIIFVDADQIVRADLQELVDLDLEGAPYGYTPFCDSRKEMDGFRFWKQGYWASHLAGRPYHISALYVVDLTRFRQFAAGDRLRGQYHGLSQDPNSLANLDQDLPNNMIHQVPIKSLPQDWLWCETWCSDESKETAKTIDLCNNPRTKEPKLTAAMRIAPEWIEYDREIKKLWRRIYPPPEKKDDTTGTTTPPPATTSTTTSATATTSTPKPSSSEVPPTTTPKPETTTTAAPTTTTPKIDPHEKKTEL